MEVEEGSEIEVVSVASAETNDGKEYMDSMPDELLLRIFMALFTVSGHTGWRTDERVNFASVEAFNQGILHVCKRWRRLLFKHIYILVVWTAYWRTLNKFSTAVFCFWDFHKLSRAMLDGAVMEFKDATRLPAISWGLYTVSEVSIRAVAEALTFTHNTHNHCRIASMPRVQQDIIITVFIAFYIRRVLSAAGNRLQVNVVPFFPFYHTGHMLYILHVISVCSCRVD